MQEGCGAETKTFVGKDDAPDIVLALSDVGAFVSGWRGKVDTKSVSEGQRSSCTT